MRFLIIILTLTFFISVIKSPVNAIDGEVNYSGINTNLLGDDNQAGPLDIGFTFNFYGVDYTTAYVNINGTLNFGSGSSAYANSHPGINNSIMPFWDDLVTGSGARSIYYATIGDEGSRKFVVQWTNMYFYSNPSLQMGTFQAIIYEGSNNIKIQYRDLLGGSLSQGSSATIGIRNGEHYTNFSNNLALLTGGQSILFTPESSTSYSMDSEASYELVYLIPDNVPNSPTLTNPPNGSTNTTVTPTFEWQTSALATSYRLIISTNSSFSGTPLSFSNILGTSYTLGTSLDYSTTYYWRVEAINENGSSLSGYRVFETDSTPNATPNIPSSVDSEVFWNGASANNLNIQGSELTMALTDDDENDQVRFRIQISKNEGFTDLLIDYRSPFSDEGIRTYTYKENLGTYLVGDANTDLIVGDYFVRLRAEDDSSAFSDWHTHSGIAFSYAMMSPSPTPTATLIPTITPTITPTNSPQLSLEIIGDTSVTAGMTVVTSNSGKNLKFSGKTEPEAHILITIRSDPKMCETYADQNGDFTCVFGFIESGTHEVEIIATTSNGLVIVYPKFVLGIASNLEDTGKSQIAEFFIGLSILLIIIGINYSDNRLFKKEINKIKYSIIK